MKRIKLLILGLFLGFVIGLLCGIFLPTKQTHINNKVGKFPVNTEESEDAELIRLRKEVREDKAAYEKVVREAPSDKKRRRQAARNLGESYAGLARYLADKEMNIPEVISLMQEGRRIENKEGVLGGERSGISYLETYLLLVKWTSKDGGGALLQYLYSPEVTLDDKMTAIADLKEGVEKEHECVIEDK